MSRSHQQAHTFGTLVALLLAAPAALALDPARAISQYGHTAWTLQDGVLPGAPTAIVQTVDGYLWIATRVGLVRFDGARFTPFTPPPGEELGSSRVLSLGAASDGSLWIGTRAGLEHWQHGHLTRYEDAPGWIMTIIEDRARKIWFTRMSVKDDKGPLCEVEGERAVCHGVADGIPIDIARQLDIDAHGAFWTVSDTTLMRWQAGSARTWLPPGIKQDQKSGGPDVLQSIAPAPDGSVWVGAMQPSRGLGLLHLVDDHLLAYVTEQLDGRKLSVSALLLDHDNALWIGTQDEGLYRLHDGRVSHYRATDGLSSDTIQSLFEDREGTLWAVTTRGIDAFRDLRVASITSREGLSADLANGVLAARNGDVLIDAWHSLDILHEGKITSLNAGNGLPGEEVTALYEDRAGTLWIGVDRDLHVYERSRFAPASRPDGSPIGLVQAIAQDVAGDLWAVTSKPDSLLRIRDRRVVEEVSRSVIPFTFGAIAADPRGGIWLPLKDGDLGRYRDGKLETVAFHREPGTAVISGLVSSSDGAIVGATRLGLIGWRDGKSQTMTAATNGLPCNEVLTLLSDRRGALWLYASCGIILIAADQMQAWWKDPAAALTFRMFDAVDGAQPARGNFFPKASVGPDGRLWFANASVVQVINPDRLQGNTVPPPVHIEQVLADRTPFPIRSGLRLPPLTRDLQIDYTALSLVVPRRTQFRYQLEGHDRDWQEAGPRRQAFYTDLPPGDYRFKVIASNNDGVWNEAGANLDFSIAPTFYQTRWFITLCVVAAAGVLWLLYLLRVRQLTERERSRVEERIAERTRLARELHDTLLQTIQGSKLVADHALEEPPDNVRLRRAMEQVSNWLGQAAKEGRDALRALRQTAAEHDDLAAALKRAADGALVDSSMEVTCATVGKPREMHPIIGDEVYRVGYEAIRNACVHSGGSKLDIHLAYEGGFILRVSDNGKGLPPETAAKGKEGHFGLQGMRERAARIDATLTILTPRGGGTRVELAVPERVAFRNAGS